jgi:hypothetical protein
MGISSMGSGNLGAFGLGGCPRICWVNGWVNGELGPEIFKTFHEKEHIFTKSTIFVESHTGFLEHHNS